LPPGEAVPRRRLFPQGTGDSFWPDRGGPWGGGRSLPGGGLNSGEKELQGGGGGGGGGGGDVGVFLIVLLRGWVREGGGEVMGSKGGTEGGEPPVWLLGRSPGAPLLCFRLGGGKPWSRSVWAFRGGHEFKGGRVVGKKKRGLACGAWLVFPPPRGSSLQHRGRGGPGALGGPGGKPPSGGLKGEKEKQSFLFPRCCNWDVVLSRQPL